MQRRLNVNLLATEIDSLDRLLRPIDGTAIVYVHPDLVNQEVQMVDARYDYRTQAKERQLRGRPFVCAIFHWIAPGSYTVGCKVARLETRVEVHAGVLVQVDWRTAFTGWRAKP